MRLDALLLFCPVSFSMRAGVYRLFHLYKGKVAICFAARSLQHISRGHDSGGFAAGARLHSGCPKCSGRVLLRQAHDHPLLVPPDVLSRAGHALLIAISAIRVHASTRWWRNPAPILVLGRAADAEVLLRAIESGAVKKIWPAGILSPSPADQGQSVRGVSVVGTLDDLESVVADFAAAWPAASVASCSRHRRSIRP